MHMASFMFWKYFRKIENTKIRKSMYNVITVLVDSTCFDIILNLIEIAQRCSQVLNI